MSQVKFDRRFVDTPFGAVHAWSAGAGPDVLLLHQSAQSADEFKSLAVELAGEFRLTSLDLPGHGASETPDHELSVAEYCEAATSVLHAFCIDGFDVVAHHGGCMLAVKLAIAQPGRVRRLALSGGGYPDPEVAELLLNNPMTRDLPMDAGGEFLRKTWSVYKKMSAPDTPTETTFLPFVVGLRARLRPYDMHFEVLRWDYRAALGRLRQRTLLIKGEHDHFSGDVEGLHASLPDSEMAVIRGGGPWLFYEQPAACADVVRRFLLDQRERPDLRTFSSTGHDRG